MKYYIIAGEASGDMHAANLITEIRKNTPDAEFKGWGGDLMSAAGCVVTKHYKDLAFMGFWEVFIHLKTVLRNFSICREEIINYQPDVIILVDYPGFNLRIAQFAKQKNIRVVYYISPQVWAWKKGRVKKIKKNVDDLLVILPFEKAFYARYNYPVHYVGHPLLDEISRFDPTSDSVSAFREKYHLDERPIVAILPGSRKQEIKTMLPVMAKVIPLFPHYQFVISVVKWQPRSLYQKFVANIPLVEGDIYSMLCNSKAAIVTSGTASLETALMEVPQVVCYKGSWISYAIAKHLIKDIHYISLPNLILNKEIFKELIQGELTPESISRELELLLHDQNVINQMKTDYSELKQLLGKGGASAKAARIISANRA